MACHATRPLRGPHQKEIAVTMTVDTLPAEAPSAEVGKSDVLVTTAAGKSPAKKTVGKKTKTLELTLTVTGTADGEWRAELKRGTTYLARNLAVAAAAVSRAARELHEDLSTPIDEVIEEARSQQAAKVAALEAELEAARQALADLDSDS
jgi:hypothetical protein